MARQPVLVEIFQSEQSGGEANETPPPRKGANVASPPVKKRDRGNEKTDEKMGEKEDKRRSEEKRKKERETTY